jgi:hypothetical protein
MNVKVGSDAATEVLQVLAGNPKSMLELCVALAAGWLTLLLVLSAAGKALGLSQSGRMMSAVTATLGSVLVIVGMVAARLYLPPWGLIWVLTAGGALVSLVIVAPLISWLHRGGYLGALLAWMFGVLAAALIIVLVGAIFDGFSAGARSADQERQHRRQIENALE